MLKDKVALELNSNGIYDYIFGRHATWNDIVGFRKIEMIKGQDSFRIGVMLIQKRTFIKHLPFILKPFCWLSSLFCSTPFVIQLGYLTGTNEDIFKMIQDYHHQIKSDS